MNRTFTRFLPLLIVFLALPASGIDVRDTRLLSDPAVSETHVAFVYADDLWIARIDGTNVRRLTSHPGREESPAFSPDGALVAFTGAVATDGFTGPYS